MSNKDEYSWLILLCAQSKWKPIVEPRRPKPKRYRRAPTHRLNLYEEAVIESEARTAVVQLKGKAWPSAMIGLINKHLELVWTNTRKHYISTVPNRIGCYLFQIGLLDASCARSRSYPCQRRSKQRGAHRSAWWNIWMFGQAFSASKMKLKQSLWNISRTKNA